MNSVINSLTRTVLVGSKDVDSLRKHEGHENPSEKNLVVYTVQLAGIYIH